MVAIKLVVASLASLAVTHPIEPRDTFSGLGSDVTQLIRGDVGLVGHFLSQALSLDGPGFAETVSAPLGRVGGQLGHIDNIVREASTGLGDTVGEVLDKAGLGKMVDQISDSVKQIERKLLNDTPDVEALEQHVLPDVKDLLDKVTSLKNGIPSTGATSGIIGKLGNLEDTLKGLIKQVNQAIQ